VGVSVASYQLGLNPIEYHLNQNGHLDQVKLALNDPDSDGIQMAQLI